MDKGIVQKIAFTDGLKLEVEVLEERVAPGLLLGFFAGANAAAAVNVAAISPCCLAAAAPPPPPPPQPPPCCCPCRCWC